MLTSFLLSVPGEAGRKLVQRYFEAEHSATAVIHPKVELATVALARRGRRSNLQSASTSSRRVPRRPSTPAQGLRPTQRWIYGQAFPAWVPYTGYAPQDNRAAPAPLYNGTVMDSRGYYTAYTAYRHGPFPFRYRVD